MALSPLIIRAKLKALDAIDGMLDDRDAESLSRLKKPGVIEQKGSDTALDGDGIGRKDPPDDSEGGAPRDSIQDGEKMVEHGEGEASFDHQDGGKSHAEDGATKDDDFMAELKRMSTSNPSAKNALSMLEDDEDENESQDKAPRPGKRRDSSRG